MVARYIPSLVVIGVALAAYRLLGIDDMFQKLIETKSLAESYDYIIVGGGSSGAVIASRLAEDKDKTILLIEAGGDPSDEPTIDVPLMADSARGGDYDWQYHTVPQKHGCLGHKEQTAIWSSGKGLGGTSLINYMQYLRGSRHNYDSWATGGAIGWAYKDVLPYFIKSEDQQNGEFVRTVFHGFGGRLSVMDVGPTTANQIIGLCFKELSLKKRDLNGRNQFGWGPTQATIRRGIRWSTYRAYLKRAMTEENLHVMTRTVAQKVIFEGKKAVGVLIRLESGEEKVALANKEVVLAAGTVGLTKLYAVIFEGKKAVGVLIRLESGEEKVALANKEVVLAAGTVGSTKLLLLSGVGPRAHLQELKIPVVADLPVGENLQDNVFADGVEFFTPYPGVSITMANADSFMSSWSYSLFGTGMKASPRFREATAYIRLRNQPASIKYPLLALQIAANPQAYTAQAVNVRKEVWDSVHGNAPSREGLTIFPVLLHPRSRGTIRLRSKNPDEAPLINPNYLAEEADVKILSEGVQFVRRLLNTKVMKDWDFQLTNRLLPDCAKLGNYTSAYIECHIRRITLPGAAPVGTAKIGGLNDPTAVVDPLLRVREVKGLRVADASIIPSSLAGDLYATQVMIGEKAADMIREKDTVKAIKAYFKHLIESQNKKIMDDDETQSHHGHADEGNAAADAPAAAGKH